MKTVIVVTLAAIIFAFPPAEVTANPLWAHIDIEPGSGDAFLPEHLDIDLRQLSVLHSRDGTTKTDSIEKLILLYEMQAVDNETFATDEHVEPAELVRMRNRRTILGADGRTQAPCDDCYSRANCATGILQNGCTAVMIGPYHALTAAHCVYDVNSRRYDTAYINMWRGRRCDERGTLMHWNSVRVPEGYIEEGRLDYDYALIIFDEEERALCWMGFGFIGNWYHPGRSTRIGIQGYPSDKRRRSGCRYDSMWYSGCTAWANYGSAYPNLQSLLRYRCDTQGPGDFGAGLYAEKYADPGKKIVYGVHAYEGSSYNSGPLITESRFCQIIEWMVESGHTPPCDSGTCCNSRGLFADAAPEGQCFPPHALVQTGNVSTPLKTMKELKVGDQVLTVNKHGELVYSPVIAFLDKVPSREAYFVKLETEDYHVVSLTPNHLIFRKELSNSSSEAVFASAVKRGDYILTMDYLEGNTATYGTLKPSKVIKKSLIQVAGTYAPLTAEGTIIVDGVAASCYATINNHDLDHAFFAPLRYLHYLFPSVVEANQEGMHWYAGLLETVGKYIHPFFLSKDEIYPTYSTLF